MKFPKNFIWGAGSSAFQIEGAPQKDGKGLSIWDDFSHKTKTINNSDTADIACDSYQKYEEDIKLLQELGVDAYRFSISWPRIFPEGIGKVNPKGLEYYDRVVDLLLKHHIEPFCTLFHWDLPLTLEEKGGWLNPDTVSAFGEYAKTIARHFDGRIKNYFTINEPQCIILLGYHTGVHAPGKALKQSELLTAMHNLLLAHGLAVKTIRENSSQNVKIGIPSTGKLCFPDFDENREAAKNATFTITESDRWDFSHSWVLDPICFGRYPEDVPDALKQFSKTISNSDFALIQQPINFIGANIYNGQETDKHGNPIKPYPGYPKTAMKWPVTPKVLRYGPLWLSERYSLPIYISENGQSANDRIFLDQQIHDLDRIDFLDSYLSDLSNSIADGADIRGYFHWSLLDNFEWNQGYDERFGLVYIDYPTGKRIKKDSFHWYKNFIKQMKN